MRVGMTLMSLVAIPVSTYHLFGFRSFLLYPTCTWACHICFSVSDQDILLLKESALATLITFFDFLSCCSSKCLQRRLSWEMKSWPVGLNAKTDWIMAIVSCSTYADDTVLARRGYGEPRKLSVNLLWPGKRRSTATALWIRQTRPWPSAPIFLVLTDRQATVSILMFCSS